jgi:hypothetical protein
MRPGAAALVHDVAGHLILEFQLFFLEAVEKVFVGVGAVLFLFDESVKRGVLRLLVLDVCLAHRCSSFRAGVTIGY